MPQFCVEAGAPDLLEHDLVRRPDDPDPLPGHLADHPHGETGAGEGLAPDHLGRQAELGADRTDLVLEQQPQRLDEFQPHPRGRPPTL